MKLVLTALFTTLLSTQLFAEAIDLSQTENDIKLIHANLKPNASDDTLRNVDLLTKQVVEDLSGLLSQKQPDTQPYNEAQVLWNKLVATSSHKDANVERILSEQDYEQNAAIRDQVDTKAMVINLFYQQELRKDPTLGGMIVVELHFLPTGYLSDIGIKSADKGMNVLATRILPILRTIRIKPQETSEVTEYKLNFFPH